MNPGIEKSFTFTGKKKSRRLSKSATLEPALKDMSIKNDFLEASRLSQNEQGDLSHGVKLLKTNTMKSFHREDEKI